MAINIIPFKMPEPMELPSHIAASLRQMAPSEAVKKSMEFLLQIDAAETMVYESVDGEGKLTLGAVVPSDGDGVSDLEAGLAEEPAYGQPFSVGGTLGAAALSEGSSLLVMGQVEEGEHVETIPGPILRQALNGAGSGNVGFIYVLTLAGRQEQPLGALTLMRSQASGPLNHDQPNITEALRLLMAEILAPA